MAVAVISIGLSGCAGVQPRPSCSASFPSTPTARTPEKASREDVIPLSSLAILTAGASEEAEDTDGGAVSVEPLFSKRYAKLVLHDMAHVVSSPGRWEKTDWLLFGGASAGLAGLTFLDKPIADLVSRNQNSTTDAIAREIEPFGAEYSFGVLAGFYVAGAALDNPKARAVAQDGLAASVIASGLITPLLKITVGRARREDGDGPHDFDPFTSRNDSFPSGHTTQAFAVASVIAAHYESPWVKAAAYGGASLVGYARVQRGRHWATDVTAGAVIGTLIGNSVVHFNEQKRAEHHASKVAWTPLFDGRTAGVALNFDF